MIKAGIVGGARILIRHPQCELSFVQSRSQAGKPITRIHRDLTGETDLIFTENYQDDVAVIVPILRLMACSGMESSP